MLLKLLLLFTVVPLLELALLIEVGTRIGALRTILIVVATGFLGALMARSQGFSVWRKLRESVEGGRSPAGGLVEGVLVLAGGLLLITPGLITDALGFILLIPPSRRAVRNYLMRKLEARSARDRYYFG